jgi:hypothetical protein
MQRSILSSAAAPQLLDRWILIASAVSDVAGSTLTFRNVSESYGQVNGQAIFGAQLEQYPHVTVDTVRVDDTYRT